MAPIDKLGNVLDKLQDLLHEWYSERTLAFKVSVAFGVLGIVWILIEHYIIPGSPEIKDMFFVASTAWFLYWLVDYGTEKVRRSEAAVKENDQRIVRILDTNPCGILMVDRKGACTYANLMAAQILGVKRSELVGQPHAVDYSWNVKRRDGSPLEGENSLRNQVVQRKETLYDLECVVGRPDGSHIYLSLNATPLYDADGAVSAMVASFFDVTERRKADELDRRKLFLAVEQSKIALMITDTQNRVEYVNPGFTRMTGYTPEEVCGVHVTALCDTTRDKCREACEKVLTAGEWRGECRNRKKNGEEYWESVTVSGIRDLEGFITHYLWLREDITEHRLADLALRESKEKFQSLVEAINDCVWEIDENVNLTYVSPRARDLLGYEPEELLGKSAFDLMPKSEYARRSEEFASIIANRQPIEHMEGIYLHRSGRHVVFEISGAPFYGPDGSFKGWRGVSRDVTKRKEAERELRESEERFRELFEQTEEPMVFFSTGTARILDVNPAAVRLYGRERQELIEGGITLFVEPEQREAFEKSISAIGTEEGLVIDRMNNHGKNGSPIIVSVRGKSIRLKDGPVSFCTFRDITERIRLEEEAKIQQAKLIHANRMAALGSIVSGVAHEVNNPNNLIMFNAPLVLGAWNDAAPILEKHDSENRDAIFGGMSYWEMRHVVPKLLRDISEASSRIGNIVGSLKDFARQDKGRRDSLIDINEIVRTSLTILNHEITRRTQNFSVDYAKDLPPIRGWAMELEQVVINIVANSLQALPDRASGVRVSTSRNEEPGFVEIRVADEGTGMSREVLQRVTEPFFSTKLDSGGLGLGLSISQSIVKEHGGTLTFQSDVGKGTVVCVALPSAMLEEGNGPGNGASSEVA